MRYFLLFAVFMSPVGAEFFAITIPGLGNLSIYRISILMMLVWMMLKKWHKVTIYDKSIKYSVDFMLLWLLYAIITVVWARDLNDWFRNVFFLFIAVVFLLLAINYITTVRDIQNCLIALFLGVLIQAVLGWYGILTLDERFVRIEYNTYIFPKAMCGNPNDLATLLFLGLCLTNYFFRISDYVWKKIIMALIAIILLMLIIKCTSRANMVGIIIATFFYVYFSGRHYKKNVAIFAILSFALLPFIIEFVLLFIRNGGLKGSNLTRVNLIKNGFVFLLETFGMGVGAGQIETWVYERATYTTLGFLNMHNWWMEILTSYGIVIFVGYIIFYLHTFISIFRGTLSYNKNIVEISKMLCAFMAGYVVSSISSSSNMSTEWLWVFWIICIAYHKIISCEIKREDDTNTVINSEQYIPDTTLQYLQK